MTLEPGDLPVYEKLCERQKNSFICVPFYGLIVLFRDNGSFLFKNSVADNDRKAIMELILNMADYAIVRKTR